jgi:hypothetical protein
MRKKEETLFLHGEKFDEKKAKEFFDEFFRGESARATAILGHTYLEKLLKELLKKRSVKNESLFEDIDNLNFKRCANLCYLTGIIIKEEREDLIEINWIRNEFAHKITINNFKKKEIKDKCNGLFIAEYLRKLSNPKSFPINTAKNIYTSGISSYMAFLNMRLLSCKRIKERKRYQLQSQE